MWALPKCACGRGITHRCACFVQPFLLLDNAEAVKEVKLLQQSIHGAICSSSM